MRKYHVTTLANVREEQTFEIEAKNRYDAKRKILAGHGNLYSHDFIQAERPDTIVSIHVADHRKQAA